LGQGKFARRILPQSASLEDKALQFVKCKSCPAPSAAFALVQLEARPSAAFALVQIEARPGAALALVQLEAPALGKVTISARFGRSKPEGGAKVCQMGFPLDRRRSYAELFFCKGVFSQKVLIFIIFLS
jgi:hypothetical protein